MSKKGTMLVSLLKVSEKLSEGTKVGQDGGITISPQAIRELVRLKGDKSVDPFVGNSIIADIIVAKARGAET